jgi:hypothetical protein
VGINKDNVITIRIGGSLEVDEAGRGNKSNFDGGEVDLRFHRSIYVLQQSVSFITFNGQMDIIGRMRLRSTYLERADEGRTKPEQLIGPSDTTNDKIDRRTRPTTAIRVSVDP